MMKYRLIRKDRYLLTIAAIIVLIFVASCTPVTTTSPAPTPSPTLTQPTTTTITPTQPTTTNPTFTPTPTQPAPAITYALPGNQVFPEGIAYDSTSNSFLVGSTNDGSIFNGDLTNGQVSVFSAGGSDNRTAVTGLKVDTKNRRLWVCGAATGLIFAYGADSGTLVRKYETPPAQQTFINDVALAPNGDTYFTDSSRPVLFKISGSDAQPGELESWMDLTNSPIPYVSGQFALNGIVVSEDGDYLVVAHSATRKLFRITVATREIREIDLDTALEGGGDGMLLDGQILYVLVRTQSSDMIVRIEMSADFSRGTIIDNFRDSSFAFPTTIAKVDNRMLVVNSQFNKRGEGLTPVLPFTISDIPIPFLPGSPSPTPIALPDSINLKLVAEGFTSPLQLVSSPDATGRIFVLDQAGAIWVLSADGAKLPDPFLDLRSKIVTLNQNYDERGLLGLAFHPSFKDNGRLFVFYSAPLRAGGTSGWNCTSHLSEFKVMPGDPNRADPASERIILQVDKPQSNHNAGTIAFGPDGYLYVPLGDGGGANDLGTGHSPGGNGQDLSTLLGKIIRIDVDNSSPYAIPPDNPFVGKDGADEIYAIGFRNPYSMSFDMGGQHELFVGDVGQALFEEVDIVSKGGNYGWRIKEGTHWFNPDNPGSPPPTGPTTDARGQPLIDPIIEYGRGQPGGFGVAVIGGYIYRGSAIPNLVGAYLFGDYTSGISGADGRVFVASRPSSTGLKWMMKELEIASWPGGHLNAFLKGIGQDSSGEIYLLVNDAAGPSGNTGRVYKVEP